MNIVLGVTGSIAAFKALDLLSKLKEKKFVVYPVLTSDAIKFVSEMSFEAILKKYPQVRLDETIQHVSLAEIADLIVIAPCTANTIGKIANGIADNLLTSLLLAKSCPVLIAPAMNDKMWQNDILQDNIKKLESYGFKFMDTKEGTLACGSFGKGKMADIDLILQEIEKITETIR